MPTDLIELAPKIRKVDVVLEHENRKKCCFCELANSFVVTAIFSPVVALLAHDYQLTRNKIAIFHLSMIQNPVKYIHEIPSTNPNKRLRPQPNPQFSQVR